MQLHPERLEVVPICNGEFFACYLGSAWWLYDRQSQAEEKRTELEKFDVEARKRIEWERRHKGHWRLKEGYDAYKNRLNEIPCYSV